MNSPVTINVGTGATNGVQQAGSKFLDSSGSCCAAGDVKGAGATTASSKSGTATTSKGGKSQSKPSQKSGGDFFSNLLGGVLNLSGGGKGGIGGMFSFLFAAIPGVGPVLKGLGAVTSFFGGNKNA